MPHVGQRVVVIGQNGARAQGTIISVWRNAANWYGAEVAIAPGKTVITRFRLSNAQ